MKNKKIITLLITFLLIIWLSFVCGRFIGRADNQMFYALESDWQIFVLNALKNNELKKAIDTLEGMMSNNLSIIQENFNYIQVMDFRRNDERFKEALRSLIYEVDEYVNTHNIDDENIVSQLNVLKRKYKRKYGDDAWLFPA